MAAYAQIVDNVIVDRRDVDIATIPPHKRVLFRPIVSEGAGPIIRTVIEADRVVDIRSYPPLDEMKADYGRRVSELAERERQRYITPGDGMAMTYREKFEQALSVNDIGEQAANALSEQEQFNAYPTLAASVGIEAPTLWDCSQLVIARYEAFTAISYSIERARLKAKKEISSALDADAVLAAYEAITWPSP